jgi:hypothetical protein
MRGKFVSYDSNIVIIAVIREPLELLAPVADGIRTVLLPYVDLIAWIHWIL